MKQIELIEIMALPESQIALLMSVPSKFLAPELRDFFLQYLEDLRTLTEAEFEHWRSVTKEISLSLQICILKFLHRHGLDGRDFLAAYRSSGGNNIEAALRLLELKTKNKDGAWKN